MTSIVDLIVIAGVDALGALSLFAVFLYCRMCFYKPIDAVVFVEDIVCVEQGVGYYIQSPLMKVRLKSSSIDDPTHCWVRYYLGLNRFLICSGFAIPIYFTLRGFLPFHIRISSEGGAIAFGFELVIVFILGGWVTYGILAPIAKKLAHYEALILAARTETGDQIIKRLNVVIPKKAGFWTVLWKGNVSLIDMFKDE